jgi:hypothetical protein
MATPLNIQSARKYKQVAAPYTEASMLSDLGDYANAIEIVSGTSVTVTDLDGTSITLTLPTGQPRPIIFKAVTAASGQVIVYRSANGADR